MTQANKKSLIIIAVSISYLLVFFFGAWALDRTEELADLQGRYSTVSRNAAQYQQTIMSLEAELLDSRRPLTWTQQPWPVDMPPLGKNQDRQFTELNSTTETTIISAVQGERHHIIYMRVSAVQHYEVGWDISTTENLMTDASSTITFTEDADKHVLLTLKDSTSGTIVDKITVPLGKETLIYPQKSFAYLQKSQVNNNWTATLDRSGVTVRIYVLFAKEKAILRQKAAVGNPWLCDGVPCDGGL